MSPGRGPSPRAACLLYAGVLLGFSFVATPAKFMAPGVATRDLLLVGRTSFGVFAWVEAAFVLLVAVLALRCRVARVGVTLVGVLVATQHLGLRPILDARVTAVVRGASPEPSGLHRVYGVLELVKLGTLLWIARSELRRAAGVAPGPWGAVVPGAEHPGSGVNPPISAPDRPSRALRGFPHGVGHE